MKKIALVFLTLLSTAVLIAQERTVSITMPPGNTYYKYTGVAADVLIPTTCDTIDVVFVYQNAGYVKKVAVKSRFDMRTTADTTVKVSVFGKEFGDDDTYVQVIASTTSSAVTANNIVQVLTSDWTETITQASSSVASYNSTSAAHVLLTDTAGLAGYPADSISVPQYVVTNAAQTITNGTQTNTPLDKSYRYYRIRYILTGDDVTGTGVKIDEIEIKLYTGD